MPLPFDQALAHLALAASRYREIGAELDALPPRLAATSPLAVERSVLEPRASAFERHAAIVAELATLEGLGDESGLAELVEPERGALERERAALEALAPWLLLKRTNVIVAVDDRGEVAALESWFARWGEHLDYVSGNQGCGCCVNIFELIGPDAVVDTIPTAFRGNVEWNRAPPPATAAPLNRYAKPGARRHRKG